MVLTSTFIQLTLLSSLPQVSASYWCTCLSSSSCIFFLRVWLSCLLVSTSHVTCCSVQQETWDIQCFYSQEHFRILFKVQTVVENHIYTHPFQADQEARNKTNGKICSLNKCPQILSKYW